jgi:hypothetical protein
MNRSSRIVMWALATTVTVGAGVYAVVERAADQRAPLPAQPTRSPVQLVLAQPFVLDQAATHWFRAEQPSYDAGYVLVLKVDPGLVVARQVAMPVLYVGAETAAPINIGETSEHLIAIVPAARGQNGEPALDLTRTPIFFGSPDLPERVTQDMARAELARAIALGVVPPSAESVEAALRPLVQFPEEYELRLQAADFIEVYAPDEIDLVNGMRVPRIR